MERKDAERGLGVTAIGSGYIAKKVLDNKIKQTNDDIGIYKRNISSAIQGQKSAIKRGVLSGLATGAVGVGAAATYLGGNGSPSAFQNAVTIGAMTTVPLNLTMREIAMHKQNKQYVPAAEKKILDLSKASRKLVSNKNIASAAALGGVGLLLHSSMEKKAAINEEPEFHSVVEKYKGKLAGPKTTASKDDLRNLSDKINGYSKYLLGKTKAIYDKNAPSRTNIDMLIANKNMDPSKTLIVSSKSMKDNAYYNPIYEKIVIGDKSSNAILAHENGHYLSNVRRRPDALKNSVFLGGLAGGIKVNRPKPTDIEGEGTGGSLLREEFTASYSKDSLKSIPLNDRGVKGIVGDAGAKLSYVSDAIRNGNISENQYKAFKTGTEYVDKVKAILKRFQK